MKTTTITKQQIIDAATTEPLLQGDQWSFDDTEDCPVCIVGSIFRRYLSITNNSTIHTYMSKNSRRDYGHHNSLNEFYESDRVAKITDAPFLNRLSSFFETIMRNNHSVDFSRDFTEEGHDKYEPISNFQRRQLIGFIETEAPDELQVTL